MEAPTQEETERITRGSGVEKVATGIDGFDDVTRGGIPRGRTTLLIGTPGSGKTVFALQTLVNGARDAGEAGIFVAFEENSRQIIANAASFGWNLPELEERKLFFLDAYLSPRTVQSGQFDIAGILAALKEKAEEMGAKRIVFDGIDVLLTLLDDPVAERAEIYRLHEWLIEHGFTGLITAKSTAADPVAPGRFDFMQFMADTVVVLHHRLHERVSLRGVRVLKYRGSSFSANEFPMVISRNGIEVATFGDEELDFEVSDQRVPTGLTALDEMLSGGYYSGSGILITGSPGTAKTSLAGAFAEAACRSGGRALYVSFDEPASQIVRNMASIGIDFSRHLESGALQMYSLRTEVRSAEEHLVVLERRIRDFAPTALVVDPISALAKSGGHVAAVDTSIRLIDFAKSRGVTVLCTSLVGGRGTVEEATDLQISTIADTWIHVAYVVQGGERNRALSIVKSRGMGHSNQVRELILSDDGAALADVYVEGGDVLMGTARFERESEERAQETRRQQETARLRRELELQRADLQGRLERLRTELASQEEEIRLLEEEQQARVEGSRGRRDAVRRLRGGGNHGSQAREGV